MVLYPNKLPESERVCSGICTHVYTNIKNVLSFREARNLGVKILTARHSDIE